MSDKILVFYDEAFKAHVVPERFAERPERLDAAMRGILTAGVAVEFSAPPPVSEDDLEAVHPRRFVDKVRDACRMSGQFDPETFTSPGTFDAATKAAGACVAAVETVLAGHARAAFCLVRPPGHHAGPERAGGFCIFNNAAIGARAALRRLGASRVLIVDWDAHHGNGTQDIFYEDPSVFYFSIHQFPLYPGSGRRTEVGKSKGRGYTLNVPIPPNSASREWMRAFQKGLAAVEQGGFKPDVVIISAGFDAYKHDPLADQNLEPEAYGRMTRMTWELARRTGSKGIVSTLEGGYGLRGLERCVREHVAALAGAP